jgi:hypothetical protein
MWRTTWQKTKSAGNFSFYDLIPPNLIEFTNCRILKCQNVEGGIAPVREALNATNEAIAVKEAMTATMMNDDIDPHVGGPTMTVHLAIDLHQSQRVDLAILRLTTQMQTPGITSTSPSFLSQLLKTSSDLISRSLGLSLTSV